MKIEAHLLCWNEIDIMRLVISHYQSFCDRIIIHDNHSSDGSAELAKELGCEVIPFGTNFFDDQVNMDLKNTCWRGSDADLVIVCDFDEILMDDDLSKPNFICDPRREFTIFKTIGWQIMSEEMPKDKLQEISNGYEFKNYAKNIIFNPKAITEINYGPGAHECNPIGDVRWCPDPLYVLHYKHIGGVQRTIKRYKEYMKRMSKNNLRNGWGIHYRQNERKLRREWDERTSISEPLL